MVHILTPPTDISIEVSSDAIRFMSPSEWLMERHTAAQATMLRELIALKRDDCAMSLSNLTSGLIGSVLGALMTFLAAAITIWRTRVGDREREERRLRERDEERREAIVAEVIGTLRALETEVRWAPLLGGRTSGHLLQATMTFYASQRRCHPDVADWFFTQSQVCHEALNRWRRTWWLLWINRRRLAELGEKLGEITAAIVFWSTGDLPDDAFADRERSPKELAASVSGVRTLAPSA